MKPHSQKFLQRRKFLMVVPLLALPFLTMIFWALGGGQGTSVQAMTTDTAGLKSTLPDAHFDGKEIWDKLSLYELAERDSAKFEQARESDPYFDLIAFESQQEPNKDSNATDQAGGELISTFQKKEPIQTDPNEERVNKKLEELITEINRPSRTQAVNTTTRPTPIYSNDPQFTSDVDRLEKMMKMINEPTEADPEMQQIESVLDKILDIQHPGRVEEKMKLNSWQEKANAFNVSKVDETDNITTIESAALPFSLPASMAELKNLLATYQPRNAFYGLDHVEDQPVNENAIEAVIHDTQEVLAGSTIRLRLLNDVMINGRLVPKDQFVYGTCSLNEERLTIQIASIRTGNSLLPVSLSVYDLDGLEGIHIPGAITRDAAKEASDNTLQNIQLMSLDPSIGAQAASAGIEAAKGLFSKKAKTVRVTVKAGYRVLLKDTKTTSQTQFNF